MEVTNRSLQPIHVNLTRALKSLDVVDDIELKVLADIAAESDFSGRVREELAGVIQDQHLKIEPDRQRYYRRLVESLRNSRTPRQDAWKVIAQRLKKINRSQGYISGLRRLLAICDIIINTPAPEEECRRQVILEALLFAAQQVGCNKPKGRGNAARPEQLTQALQCMGHEDPVEVDTKAKKSSRHAA